MRPSLIHTHLSARAWTTARVQNNPDGLGLRAYRVSKDVCDTVGRYRERAGNLRTIAVLCVDKCIKATLLAVADDWDAMAASVVRIEMANLSRGRIASDD